LISSVTLRGRIDGHQPFAAVILRRECQFTNFGCGDAL
jgi:hypothetical protein